MQSQRHGRLEEETLRISHDGAHGAGLLRTGELTSESESARLPGTAEGREEEEEGEEKEGRGVLKTEQHPAASQVAAGFSLCASAASFPLPLLLN